MKRLLLIPLVLFVLSCGDRIVGESEDTTPPEVTITYPGNNAVIGEIFSITCVATDNESIEKVQLWVDGFPTDFIDETEPYLMSFDTRPYTDGSPHILTVRAFDTNGNKKDSDPITVVVNNISSYPQSVNITSIMFGDGSFTITWNQSTDSDFGSYLLEKSVESTMGDYEVVYTTEIVTDTTFVDSDVDPLSYQYYRITVIDTFGYETKGQIESSSLDPLPTSVNVISVTYTLEEMTVEWEESVDDDFKNYKLLYSETESGDKDTVITYTDKSTTSHILSDFDPTHLNWFWVLVSDTLGQNSLGSRMTNQIDSLATQINISSITYDLSAMVISWGQFNDWDFFSYELLYSDSEAGEQTSIITITDINTTSYTISEFDPSQERWYWIIVTDYWGQTTVSNSYMVLDSPPTPSEINPIVYENGSFIISWSQNDDDDFQSYTLYESLSEDMSGQTEILSTNDNTETSYTITGVSENEIRYYQIVVEDIWGLQSDSVVVNIGFISDIDGKVYQIVQIGGQVWMAENLKVNHYRNGDQIPTGYSNDEWEYLSTGAYAVYNDDPSNAEIYGNLYNWYAVDDERGVCPEGWYVPTDGQYLAFSNYLGGTSVAGGKMKECTEGSCPESEYWDSPNTGATNESGFAGLPGGYRYYFNGFYFNMGFSGYFWSSTENGSNDAWSRKLNYDYSGIYRFSSNKRGGFSVRCIRD